MPHHVNVPEDELPTLVDVLDELLSMVCQYATDHRSGRLWSAYLTAPADAMRILWAYGLLENVDDLANRDVWADAPTSETWPTYKAKLDELRKVVG